MCGIAGLISLDPNQITDARSQVGQIQKSLHHRGPDDRGDWTDNKHSLLIHTRLAIVDLSPEGHQPMADASNRLVISFNGEIYNHHELRKELSFSGVAFKGSSDTEVLLACVAKFGVDQTLAKIEGMFAFAIWDQAKQELTLARDRFGEKPLYVHSSETAVLFGSELKSIHQLPGFQPQLDLNGVFQYLQFNFVPDSGCIFQNTYKIAPGTYEKFSVVNGEIHHSKTTYWDAHSSAIANLQNFRRNTADDNSTLLQTEERLKTVIGRQLMADVPVGCLLSGGIDSSLVAAIAQSQSRNPIRTFTIGYDIPQYNEAPMAKAVAHHLGTKHQEWILQPNDVLKVIPKIPDIYDEPFADSSQLPTYLLAEMVRQEVTVCLSGDGGDELFGGYNRYVWTERTWNAVNIWPKWLRSGGAWTLDQIPPQIWHFVERHIMGVPTLSHKVKKIADLLRSATADEVYAKLLLCWPRADQLASFPHLSPQSIKLDSKLMLQDAMMICDTGLYLPGDILTKVDRATMAHSLESRTPFLDHHLYELAWKLPGQSICANGKGKLALRKILSKYVPPHLWERPKSGFAVPLDHWFRADLKTWVTDLLSDSAIKRQGLFDSKIVQQYIDDHMKGRRNWQYQLWNLAVFQSWCQKWGI